MGFITYRYQGENYYSNSIYIIILFIVIISQTFILYTKTIITVNARGTVRPQNDRVEIKAPLAGYLDSIVPVDGKIVSCNELLAIIKDEVNLGYYQNTIRQISTNDSYISDLLLLIKNRDVDIDIIFFKSSNYRSLYLKFKNECLAHESLIYKAEKEIEVNKRLLKDKVISSKEYFDNQVEFERLKATYEAFKNGQKSIWETELQRCRDNNEQLLLQKKELEVKMGRHFVFAPVGGSLQSIRPLYPGTYIAAGEILCTISPETTLIGECFVNTTDVGLLKLGQQARFQIDAFDYNYFGILTGKIISIDNDFTIVDNKPVFKVRCSFDSTQLHLKNGYKGELKKGLSFQARFIVAERTLWQLLFDKIDDWLNPTAPVTNHVAKVS